ncbi:MAG: type II secretion system minor pseudopilin GspH [Agarilytica sp.]
MVINNRGDIKHSSGFTLIEVLVVLMIIGIAVGGVSVFFTQDGPDEDLKKTIERFVVIGDHISELAVLGGEPIGMLLEPPEWRENPLDEGWRYSWQRMTPEGWQELEDVLPVEIPNAMELNVFIDEQEWKYEDAPKELIPILAFYPSGEVTPFEIEFMHEELTGDTQNVKVNLWGEVVWVQRQEQEEEAFGNGFE